MECFFLHCGSHNSGQAKAGTTYFEARQRIRAMAWFIYKIQPVRMDALAKGWTESEVRIVDEHFSYLKGLHSEGTVLLAGRTTNTDSSSFGIIIFKAESEKRAAAIVRNDPAVRKGVFRAELFSFGVALPIIGEPSSKNQLAH